MTLHSAIPGFKTALETRLKADSAFTGANTTVCVGNPYPKQATRELVAIGKATRAPLQYRNAMSGARETFSLVVLVSVIGAARDGHELLEARAWDLAAAVSASVLAWAAEDFGGHAVNVTEGEASDDENIDGDARECAIELNFEVQADI